jgi:hypothetical protein
MALVLAVFSLAVIGALVSGIFFAGRLEQQSGQNTLFAVQAGEAAEAGLNAALTTLQPTMLEGLVAGAAPLDLGSLNLPGGTIAGRQVQRLTGDLFLIRARGIRQGAAGTTLAARSVGLLVRLDPAAGDASEAAGIAPLGERAWVQLY